MLLSELRQVEMSERIEDLAARGDLEALKDADPDVVMECARRYLELKMRKKSRTTSRAREQFAKVRDEADARLNSKVRSLVAEIERDLHEEWTAELLLGAFSLPDGTRVTWGTATVTQHEARAQQLESMASGDLRTASIHRAAVKDIREAGAISLSGAVG